MAETSEQHLDAIARDVCCPNCEYNLRGLTGETVTCPECGSQCDVLALMHGDPNVDWREAPGLQEILAPGWTLVGCAVLGLVAAFASASTGPMHDLPQVLLFMAGVSVFATPLQLMPLVKQWGMYRALVHACSGFAVGLLYVMAPALLLLAICFFFGAYNDPKQMTARGVTIGLILAPLAVAAAVGGYRTHRYLGHQCLARIRAERSKTLERLSSEPDGDAVEAGE